MASKGGGGGKLPQQQQIPGQQVQTEQQRRVVQASSTQQQQFMTSTGGATTQQVIEQRSEKYEQHMVSANGGVQQQTMQQQSMQQQVQRGGVNQQQQQIIQQQQLQQQQRLQQQQQQQSLQQQQQQRLLQQQQLQQQQLQQQQQQVQHQQHYQQQQQRFQQQQTVQQQKQVRQQQTVQQQQQVRQQQTVQQQQHLQQQQTQSQRQTTQQVQSQAQQQLTQQQLQQQYSQLQQQQYMQTQPGYVQPYVTYVPVGTVPVATVPVVAVPTTQYRQVAPAPPSKTPLRQIQTPGGSPPVFIEIFRNARFAQGGTALFEGRIKGVPKPSVQWMRGDKIMAAIPGKHTMTYNESNGYVSLRINNIGASDQGEYTCYARNDCGEAVCTVYIQPEGALPASLKQSINEEQALYEKHMREKRDFEQRRLESTTTDFRVDSFEYRLLNELEYRKTVTDSTVVSTTPPKLTQKPRNTKLIEGATAVFTVKHEGNPTVTWFKDGVRIVESNRITITNTENVTRLEIKYVLQPDSGHYTVLLQNELGSVVASSLLAVEKLDEENTLKLAPKFLKIPPNQTLQSGKCARIETRCVGRPIPDITWYINGREVVDSGVNKVIINEQGMHCLLITSVGKEHGGVLTCVGRNCVGEDRFEIELNLEQEETLIAPKFVERFNALEVEVGSEICLNVRAVGVPPPQISWQKDGVALRPSQRVSVQNYSGASRLEIANATTEDSGWYTAMALNSSGSTATRARVHVVAEPIEQGEPWRLTLPRPTKVIEPEAPQAPETIYLRHVTRSTPKYQRQESEPTYDPPVFLTPLHDVTIQEFQRAHFEAKVVPVGDPSMIIKWYFNGSELSASSRINITYRFGFIALDILQCTVSDSGVYTCRVGTERGSAESSAVLGVVAPPPPTPQYHPSKLQYLEDRSTYTRRESVIETYEAPRFVRQITNLASSKEGATAHLAGEITPSNDPDLRTEWLKNGRSITEGSRTSTITNFGYVSLKISDLRREDSGVYTCRAWNKAGEAVSNTQVTVEVVHEPLIRPAPIEPVAVAKAKVEEEIVQMAPKFLSQIRHVSVKEGAFAHFEARLEPISDPNMQVNWYKDGQLIQASSRITSFYNFGYVALTIKQINKYDAGVYTCQAVNQLGQDHTQAALKIDVEVEQAQQQVIKQSKAVAVETVQVQIPPRFVSELKYTKTLKESQSAHFETRLEPLNDENMVITWYKDGKQLDMANRINSSYDFGYVALDIKDLRTTDSGEYVVVARNKVGQAELRGRVQVLREEITTASTYQASSQATLDQSRGPPRFIQELQREVNTKENSSLHLKGRLDTTESIITWYKDGKELTTGSRFKTMHDFGYVALDIMKVSTNDTGVYTCVARNSAGQAMSQTTVIVDEEMIEDNGYQNLEDRSIYQRQEEEEVEITEAPRFTKNLHDVSSPELSNVHLEARLLPINDPNMRITWYKNDSVVPVGQKYRPVHEFDYVALDIVTPYVHDSGIYTVIAQNKFGEAVTNCQLTVTDQYAKCPKFLTKPKNGTIVEMGRAHFECKLMTSDGVVVQWYKDGEILQDGTRFVLLNDFGYVALDILKCVRSDQGIYTCIASNQYGSDRVDVELRIGDEGIIEGSGQCPAFTSCLRNIRIKESEKAHFEAKLIPVSDETMTISWYKDGFALKEASRYTKTEAFGFVALDIQHCTVEDAGTYTCRAVNSVGEAVTSGVMLVDAPPPPPLTKPATPTPKQRAPSPVQQATPPLFTQPLRDVSKLESTPVHLEARLIPVGDPTMELQWFKNGVPIQASNRVNFGNDFGYVSLDLNYAKVSDSGSYTCRARNSAGEASTVGKVTVYDQESAESNEAAMRQIQMLESKTIKKIEEDVEVKLAPKFITPLAGVSNCPELSTTHLETRLINGGEVKWYKDGKELPAGHRFRPVNDFGFVAIDILDLVPEDKGVYKCVATNKYGSDSTQITINVQPGGKIFKDTLHEESMGKIQQLESPAKRQKVEPIPAQEKPRFVRNLNNVQILENADIHIEGSLVPVNDPKLTVQWLKNGAEIPASNKLKLRHDFGFVSLDIKGAYVEDSGVYTCRAVNEMGEAVSSCNVEVQIPAEAAMSKSPKFANLEKGPAQRAEQPLPTFEKPHFTKPLQPVHVTESEHVHLESRIVPSNDPNMVITWFKNGEPLKEGHRFKKTEDFGYVALDILYAYPEDSGTYWCGAKNLHGEANVSCEVSVGGTAPLHTSTLHEPALSKIQRLEAPTVAPARPASPPPSAPVFTSELHGTTLVRETESAHFECRVEPKSDPNLTVTWLHNGKELQMANRHRITHDFGYVALDISKCVMADAGVYTAVAKNKAGQGRNDITLQVIPETEEKPNEDTIAKLAKLEEKPGPRPQEQLPTYQKPMWTVPIKNVSLNEAENLHLEGRVVPVGDPKLVLYWFKDGELLEESSRLKKVHDFGYASLDIVGVRGSDAGVYMCRAVNDQGEAVTTASVEVGTHANILTSSHHPEGLAKIQQLEAKQPPARVEPVQTFEKPAFTAVLTGPAEVWEGETGYYECKVIPVQDPNLIVEWFLNGVEIQMGSRHTATCDFGHISLTIKSMTLADSGVYSCKVSNKAGSAVTSTSTKVKAREQTNDSLHPQALQKIAALEAPRVQAAPDLPAPQQPPIFTRQLISTELVENTHLHLEAFLEPRSDPNLKVEWFKNGEPLEIGSRMKANFDFGLVTLDISGAREADAGMYVCRGWNKVGEARTSCVVKVAPHVVSNASLHPQSLEKIALLEAPAAPEPERLAPAQPAPFYLSHLNDIHLMEGETAHFHCNVEPKNDPDMIITWYKNGELLEDASRIRKIYEFGRIELIIDKCLESDKGLYSVVARNRTGEASTAGTLKVDVPMSVDTTLHPKGAAGMQKVDEVEAAFQEKSAKKEPVEATFAPQKPYWKPGLKPEYTYKEGDFLQLQCQAEPRNDPHLKIEWKFNGEELLMGTRFKSNFDFGYVSLDMEGVEERDAGIYTCRCWNQWGEAITSCVVSVGDMKPTIVTKTTHPKGDQGLAKIKALDKEKAPEKPVKAKKGQPPKFTTPFKDLMQLTEGDLAHFEANLIPIGDPEMVIEWFFEGVPIQAGARIRTVYAFGMVVIEIQDVKFADSGTYTCRARNAYGEDTATLKLGCVEYAVGQPPRFTRQIQPLDNMLDGSSAHFEATLVPVGDPDMVVEWLKDGEPIMPSSRIKTIYDFGFVSLDITGITELDTGEYECRAKNLYGKDRTVAFLRAIGGHRGVETNPLQPDAYAKILELEGFDKNRPELTTPFNPQPPKFTEPFQPLQLIEGQSAHFEARLIPIDDPDLEVKFYRNGVELKTGHKYRTFHDFGVVILDVLYSYEEDGGVYEARAVNKLGHDETSATMTCKSKPSLILDPQVPKSMLGTLDKIPILEAAKVKKTKETPFNPQQPVFTTPFSNASHKAGEIAHFEARLTPTDDPKLTIKWYKNGRELRHGSRFKTFHDFGFVVLEISSLQDTDQGIYECRAENQFGEAVCTAELTVLGGRTERTNAAALSRIADLENLPQRQVPQDTSKTGASPVLTQINPVEVQENGIARFEARLSNYDENTTVTWFKDGVEIKTGSRFKTINDFGHVVLEIKQVMGRDAGNYTCVATNTFGSTNTSTTLAVHTKQSIITAPQLPSNYKNAQQSINVIEENLYKKPEQAVQPEQQPRPPKFLAELEDSEIIEGEALHFATRVEPAGDDSMRIEWYFNGKPLATGSRVHTSDDFGFVSLDMDYVFARDAGEYLCRAVNKWGFSSTRARVVVKGKAATVTGITPATASKLSELERGPIRSVQDAQTTHPAPHFTHPLTDLTIGEGESANFETRVEPKNDPNLVVEWWKDGKRLVSGSRFKSLFEFGLVRLEIGGCRAEDSGLYECIARGSGGETKVQARVVCKPTANILLENQLPKGMKPLTLAQIQTALQKYTSEIYLTEDDLYDTDKKQPPRFVTQIQPITAGENQPAMFECQVGPVGDPNMVIEWYKDGKLLRHANRLERIDDFGYVALKFGWIWAEDGGTYECRARNLYGSDSTTATIMTSTKPSIDTSSQLPVGMQSVNKIRELESVKPSPYVPEVVQQRAAPIFVTQPAPVQVFEGDWARFVCRVTGFPRPRVLWIVNGKTVVNGTRYKLTYDGMHQLDIPKTRQYDAGEVKVIAKNVAGEAFAVTTLAVTDRMTGNYRGVLKQRGAFGERAEEEEESTKNIHAVNLRSVEKVAKSDEKKETEWQAKARKLGETKISDTDIETNTAVEIAKSVDKKTHIGQVIETKLKRAAHEPRTPLELSGIDKSSVTNISKQVQKESKDGMDITRKITKKETTDTESFGKAVDTSKPGQKLAGKPPVFTTKIQPCVCFEKEQGKFTVEFEGDPLPTVKWYREDFEIHDSPDFRITTSGRRSWLVIREVFPEDSGIFACIASNTAGQAKCSANLLVDKKKISANPPSFTETIKDTKVKPGQDLKFQAVVAGQKPIDVMWLKDNARLHSSLRISITQSQANYGLSILKAKPEDSGKIECVAINKFGEARCSAEAIVEEEVKPAAPAPAAPQQAKPSANAILKPLQDVEVTEGKAAVLQATIRGAGRAVWLKNKAPLQPSKYFKTQSAGDNHSLRITQVFPEDEGVYTLKVGDLETSCTVTVNEEEEVLTPPVLKKMKDITVEEGEPAIFKVEMIGGAGANVQWYREGALIPQSEDFEMSTTPTHAILNIKSTYEEDSGVFTCRASNDAGQVESSARLTVTSE